jgi:undecaprenyl-diphosphatase
MRSLLNYISQEDLIFLNVFNSKIKCRFLDIIMPVLTYLASAAVTITLCLIAILNSHTIIHLMGVNCALALSFSNIASQLLKKGVNRTRPYLKLETLYTKKIGIDMYSFPSGHTTAAFSMCVMISLFFPDTSPFLILLASGIGISRMYLGVHYPSDVMAGMLVGTLTSFLVFFLI